ncbi:aldo/keto reductase [Bacteroidota bacterium]
MEKRTCGSSDLELSVLGLGCWTFGGGEYWGEQSQKDVNEVVHAAVDQGINYFDNAEVYNEGRSESSFGEALKEISRDKVIIGSKVSTSNCYKDTLIEHCEGSLKRMKADYIDLYMIHWPIHPNSIKHYTNDPAIITNPPTIEEAIEAMQILVKDGKIRYFGVSNFGVNRLEEVLSHDALPVANQVVYNLISRGIEYSVLPFCQENNIGIIGYMTLMQGVLAGKFDGIENIPEWRKRTRHFNKDRTELSRHGEEGAEYEMTLVLDEMNKISMDTGITMSDLATTWVVANKSITCSIVGARNLDQLKLNTGALEAPITPGIINSLNDASEPIKEKLGDHIDIFEGAENDRTI